MAQDISARLGEEISSLLMSVTGVPPTNDPSGGGGGRRGSGGGSGGAALLGHQHNYQPHGHSHAHHHHHHHHQHPIASGSGGPTVGGNFINFLGISPEYRGNYSSGGGQIGAGGRTQNGRGQRAQQQRYPPYQTRDLDSIVHDFLVSVTGGTGGAQAGGAVGGGSMYFMSNPADYVYGREGLDSIVTQLLNQMDGTGPPPLARNRIAEIPVVAVTAEQVAGKQQCAVCWDDFALDERVRKLPCVVSGGWGRWCFRIAGANRFAFSVV